MAVTGIDGLPAPTDAGNVLLPSTVAKLSLRLPPTLDGVTADDTVRTLMEKDPPYGARVAYKPESNAVGWHAPALSPWLEQSLAHASEAVFGAPPAFMGEGGTIPFMGNARREVPTSAVCRDRRSRSSFKCAHGPYEFLHIPNCQRVTAVIAQVLADHHARPAPE